MTPIASARMYSWSPSLTAAWHRLLAWVSERAEVPMAVLDASDPLPLDDIWRREDLGCVVPIPSPPRYGGRPVYFISRRRGGRSTTGSSAPWCARCP